MPVSADRQILALQSEPVPLDYLLNPSVEFRLKAVSALFTDNGAGGDWLPAVVILSDAGHVIARALLPDVIVTAGDDAEVSWFPGVKPSSASTPFVTQWVSAAHYGGDAVQTVAGFSSAYITWTHFHTSDVGLYSRTQIVNPNDGVFLGAQGMYWAVTSVTFAAAANAQDIRIQNAAFPYQDTSYNQLNSKNAGALYGQPWKLVDTQQIVTPNATQKVGVLVQNHDAAGADITAAELGLFYWPNDVGGNP